MEDLPHQAPHILYFLVGALVVFTFLVKPLFKKIAIPSLVGFLLLGIGLKSLDMKFHLISAGGMEVFHFMASVGLIILLFRTGLEEDTEKLKANLGPAALIWIGNFFLSGILGFVVAYYWLHLGMITSLVIATAFTATSIAVSIGIWREAGAMNTRGSNLLMNVAQMDDISGVAALALLLGFIPMLTSGEPLDMDTTVRILGLFSLNLALFGGACVLFAKYLEAPITRFFEHIGDTGSCLMLLTAGTGVMIAAIAEGMGLSIAVGALFAGLVFSQNPRSDYIAEMLRPIHDLFAPFFFIGIGLAINPELLAAGFGLGIILLIPAVLGKVIGGAIPSLLYLDYRGSMALGLSLVPRAEIMLIIAESARRLGDDILPDDVFAALIFISAVTCITIPPLVRPLLKDQAQMNT